MTDRAKPDGADGKSGENQKVVLRDTAIFASIAQDSTAQSVKIAVGLISIIAAVLSALQTFLSYGELAQKHKVAGVKYGALRREIEEALTSDLETQLTSVDLKSIRTRWDAIDQEVPPLPQRIYNKVTREFRTGG